MLDKEAPDPENTSETYEEESEGLLGQETQSLRKRRGDSRIIRICLAFSVTVNLLLLAIGSTFWIHREPDEQPKLAPEPGTQNLTSELASIKSQVDTIQQEFTGEVELDASGQFFINHTSTDVKYVGVPSPQIDKAWNHLLTGLNIDLVGHDAAGLEGKTFQWPNDGSYFTGLEVFHSLHCLNRIRQALSPDYYKHTFNNPDDPSRESHISSYHCIDHLRQGIQCHSDLTPMEWTLVGEKLILKSNTLHTCRDFEKVHKWAEERETQLFEKEEIFDGRIVIVD